MCVYGGSVVNYQYVIIKIRLFGEIGRKIFTDVTQCAMRKLSKPKTSRRFSLFDVNFAAVRRSRSVTIRDRECRAKCECNDVLALAR